MRNNSERMRRGFGTKEALLAVAVIGAFAAIIIPLGLRQADRRTNRLEVTRLRQVFLAMDLYENDHAGAHPDSIYAARTYMPTDDWMTSVRDPFAKANGPFPCDGGNARAPKTCASRVSDAYLWSWVASRDRKDSAAFDSRRPWLVDEFEGSVKPGEPFQAEVSGRVFRLNMDGSLFIDDLPSRRLGDAAILFRLPTELPGSRQ